MYHRNVKFECILCKFCMLDSEVLCEICTKFYLKILSDSRVIDLQILMIKYYGFQCCVLQSLSDVLTQSYKQ